MKKLLLLFAAICCMALTGVRAEVFTTSPSPLQQSSQDVKIIFDANESGIAGLKSATELYAHTGVCVKGSSSWSYVKCDWSANTAANQFVKRSDGKWELNVGDINTYYDLPAGVEVGKIAIIARTKNGSAQTADYFLDVVEEGFAIGFSYDKNLVISETTTINFTLSATQNAALKIAVDGATIAEASNTKSISKAYTFNTPGKFYEVTATATANGQTLTETVTVAYPTASSQENYPGGVPKMGAVKQADGSVLFCLAAPNKKSVILVGSWDDYQTLNKNVMKYQDYNGYRYFWTKVTGLKNDVDYPYYYLVDGTNKVADPYAKMMLDCYSDKWMPKGVWKKGTMPQYPYDKFDDTMLAVYRGNIDDYNWDAATLNFKNPNKTSMVVYEINLRDFTGDGSDQDGKHFGTFSTAKEKLDYLQDLGVNVIEVMPVMEFNGNSSWGYNTNGYMALDKIYGSPTDMRDFVAAAHRRGMAVVLDIVFNQTDGLHPWYQMYDINSNPFYNKNAPHSYSVLNDVNQDCPIIQQHWEDVLRYWMEAYKIDGYRFDLVKGLGDNGSYGSGTDNHNSSRIARMKKLNNVITSVRADGIHINELLGAASEENANYTNGGQLNWNKVCEGGYEYAMGWQSNKLGNTYGFYAPNWGRTLGATVDYIESHDEARMAYQVKAHGHNSTKYSTTHPSKAATIQRLGAAAAQMLLCPGAKMIWQFGEIAADEEQGTELNKLRPIEPKWNQFDNQYRNALYHNYRDILGVRNENLDMFDGTASFSQVGLNGSTYTAQRYIKLTKGNREIIGFFNPNVNGSMTIQIPVQYINSNNCKLVTSAFNYTPQISFSGNMASLTLPSHCFAVFSTNNVAGIENVAGDLDDNNMEVYGTNGEIVILGDYNSAEVYDLSGRAMGSLYVPAGIYVVRVDGASYKVSVK